MIAQYAHKSIDPSHTGCFLDTAWVNRFQGSYDPRPIETLTLRQALTTIRSDNYQRQVELLRDALFTHGKGIYDHYKKKLDAFTFAGMFNPRRGKEGLTQHSGLVHLDYDHIDVDTTRGVLCSVFATTYVFLSPSGCGVKAGVRVQPVASDHEYKHAWQAVADHFRQHYGLAADESGKDVSRLCYASYDPWCFVNDAPAVFDVPPMQVHPPQRATPAFQNTPCASDRRQSYIDQAVARAVKIIESSYPAMPGMSGNRHYARLRAARLLGGYVEGGLLTFDHAHAILEAVVVANTMHVSKSMRTIDAGLRYGMRTPVTFEQLEQERLAWCAAHGYTPRRGESN